MKITVLAENTAVNNTLESEHGLSLYIETGSLRILFDMGQSDLFERNAKILDIDLSSVDIAVLSHGHYDHGGGLQRFLEINEKAPVFVSRHAFGDYFNGCEKYIGLDKDIKDSARLVFTDEEYNITEGLTLYSCNEKNKVYDFGSFGLSSYENGIFLPDSFLHEQYLLIEESEKRILISGCSHKGILNISEWFKPDALVGGFHFSKLALDEKLKHYADILSRYDTLFYTCHCTGVEQCEFMKAVLPRLSYISTGSVTVL